MQNIRVGFLKSNALSHEDIDQETLLKYWRDQASTIDDVEQIFTVPSSVERVTELFPIVATEKRKYLLGCRECNWLMLYKHQTFSSVYHDRRREFRQSLEKLKLFALAQIKRHHEIPLRDDFEQVIVQYAGYDKSTNQLLLTASYRYKAMQDEIETAQFLLRGLRKSGDRLFRAFQALHNSSMHSLHPWQSEVMSQIEAILLSAQMLDSKHLACIAPALQDGTLLQPLVYLADSLKHLFAERKYPTILSAQSCASHLHTLLRVHQCVPIEPLASLGAQSLICLAQVLIKTKYRPAAISYLTSIAHAKLEDQVLVKKAHALLINVKQ